MPTMPSLPSRKISKLWSGSSKPQATPEADTMPTEYDNRSTSDRSLRDVSNQQQPQQRLMQIFTDKDRGGDGLAADINLRRKTNERLYSAVEAYWSSLNKSKPLPFEISSTSALEIAMTLDEAQAACQSSYPDTSPLVLQAAEDASKSIANGKERMLPIEALGLAMASCATTYSRSQKEEVEDKIHLKKNEAYASHLSYLSAVHLALAQLQADYTSSLSSTLLSRLARSQAAIEALRTTEKGTEAAREKMEAAERKRDKAREKGDKNRRDVEEEARMARATYEESLADLETRTEILRESEQKGPGSGVAILKEYMDVHLAWVDAQHDVLSRAKASLDQYPTNQNTSPARTKARPAPPPPPPSTQTTSRRVVEPPPMLKEGNRMRSVSSSHMLHKPKMTSRTSLNDVLLKTQASKEETTRPSSRSSNSNKEEMSSSSRGKTSRAPFVRSESYSGYNTSNDALGGDAASKNEGLKSRIGEFKATFARSTSSLGHNISDATTAKTTPSTTGERAVVDFSSSEKSGSWASNLLSRKNKDAKKGDGNYKVVLGDEQGADQSRLSHVQEMSAESRTSGLEGILMMQSPSSTAAGQEGHPFQFEDRRDSLDISSHLTGNTVSSEEGGNPFGHEGDELSPIGTGNGQFIGLAKEAWGHGVDDENDPADGLLGSVKDNGTIRKSMKR